MTNEYATRDDVERVQRSLDGLRHHVDVTQEETEKMVNVAISSSTKTMRWMIGIMVGLATIFFTLVIAGDQMAQGKQAAIDSQQNASISEADRKLIEALKAIRETSILMREQAKKSDSEDAHLAKEILGVERRTNQQIERTLASMRRHEQRGH